MTWLKFVNMFIFQWFFVRLTICEKTLVKDFQLISFDYMSDGSMSSRGTGTKVLYKWYSIQGFILPLTGWTKKMIFLTKPFFIEVSEKIEYPIIEKYR